MCLKGCLSLEHVCRHIVVRDTFVGTPWDVLGEVFGNDLSLVLG